MTRGNLSWDKLTLVHDGEYGQSVWVRPGISLTLYSDVSLATIGPYVADALQSFAAAIPAGSLRTYLAGNGYHKPLSTSKINKDQRELRAIDETYEDYRLEYSEGEEGDVGHFTARFAGVVPAAGFENASQLLRFEFPPDSDQQLGTETFIDLLCHLAEKFPYHSGSAGYAFKRSGQAATEESNAINAMLSRYLGFDAGYTNLSWSMNGRTPRAHWLNFIGPETLKNLGGIEMFRSRLPGCHFREVGVGWMIRAAKHPPIGDINRRAIDIGCIPDVARLLKLTRVTIDELGEGTDSFSPEGWLAAFDTRACTLWDNT